MPLIRQILDELSSYLLFFSGETDKLSTIDIAAICISIGLALFFVCSIGILLQRGANKIKQSKRRHRARTISQSSSSCQVCNKYFSILEICLNKNQPLFIARSSRRSRIWKRSLISRSFHG